MRKYPWQEEKWEPLKLSPETLARWAVEVPILQGEWDVELTERLANIKEFKRLSELVFPSDQATRKYIIRKIFTPNRNVARDFEDSVTRRIKLAQEAKVKDDALALKAAEADAKTARAIIYLQHKGKALGADFTPLTAIQLADEIAFSEAVATRIAKGGLMGFSGEDYCEDCGGWDMVSRRCECGNRRVSFDSSEFDFEHPEWLHAEAY